MGIPSRLHGDAVANFFGSVRGFCPKCLSFREWTVIRVSRTKYYKKCQKCGKRKEVEEPELTKLVEAATTRRAREKAKKKETRK
jgi:hypothetical protein